MKSDSGSAPVPETPTPLSKAYTISYRELVFDLNLYPRMEVDAERVGILKDALEVNGSGVDVDDLIDRERVAHLREILEFGGVLPPIVVDTKTHKVIDGFHRSRAYFSLRGSFAEIPCSFHDYVDKAAMFLDAIRLNASHGKPLTRSDQTRCVALAERLNVTRDQVASVMSVRPDKLADIKSVRASLATPVQVQTLRVRRAPSHVERTSGGERQYTGARGLTRPTVGMGELNAVVRALKNGDLDLHARDINETVRFMVKIGLERLRESAAA